jgi:hypothetical protein
MRICSIQLEGLQKCLSGEAVQGTKALPLYWLDRLTAIFRFNLVYLCLNIGFCLLNPFICIEQ